MKNILVGIEFHEKFDLLIDKALEVSESDKLKLWILHVAAPEPDFVGYKVGPQFVRNNRAKELREEHKILQEHASNLRKRNINAHALLIEGATTETILQESKKLNIDLIICGQHTHGFLYKMLFGSTAIEVVHESEIPVLVVPLDDIVSTQQEIFTS
ncbi:universal stress protein [bacterium]|nr:universal stress protein [bacterium]